MEMNSFCVIKNDNSLDSKLIIEWAKFYKIENFVVAPILTFQLQYMQWNVKKTSW